MLATLVSLSRSKFVKYAPPPEVELATLMASQMGLSATASALRSLARSVRPNEKYDDLESGVEIVHTVFDAEVVATGNLDAMLAHDLSIKLAESMRDASVPLTIDNDFVDRLARAMSLIERFDEVIGATKGTGALERESALHLRQIELLWLIEILAKPLEENLKREFKKGRPNRDSQTKLDGFWTALQDLMAIDKVYEVKSVSNAFPGERADSILVRNSIAHALTSVDKSRRIVAALFDPEAQASVGEVRLSAQEMENWIERIMERVGMFYFVVALNGALMTMVRNDEKVMVKLLRAKEEAGTLKRIHRT